MTLSQIMTLALRQLDEDAQDISEYDEVFRVYANAAYAIAVRNYVRPRQSFVLETDENGLCPVPDARVVRLVELRDVQRGAPVAGWVLSDGRHFFSRAKNAQLIAVFEIDAPPMQAITDEPVHLPPEAHPALADYICYRHLSCGSMAKQAKGKHFLACFYDAMSRIRPHGMGSVVGYTHLYDASDVRRGR